jgi:hypothetical protein
MSTKVTIIKPAQGQPEEFERYDPSEIVEAWNAEGHFDFKFFENDSNFLVFFTDDKIEALIVSALFIREMMTFPECTYYDEKSKALLLYYAAGGPVPGDVNMARAIAMDLMERVMSSESVRKIKKDIWGEWLFWPTLEGK